MNHSSALVYSTRPPVSVYSTGTVKINDSGFSWEHVYLHIRLCKHSRYYQVRLKLRICLQLSKSTPFNQLFRQLAEVSLLRPHFSLNSSTGILTGSSIGLAIRLILRPRLTLIRLALIRNPWSFGVRVSRPHCRYLYLHLLFYALQQGLSLTFNAHRMLPYHSYIMYESIASVIYLCPIIIHARSLD